MQETNASSTVQENVSIVARLEAAANGQVGPVSRASEAIADFAGTGVFVLINLGWFGAWLLANTVPMPGVPQFDPYPFNLLCMLVSMEGTLLAVFVLIKQNRLGALADRRAHLDLQVNLLTEDEVTRTLRIVRKISERLGIETEDHEAIRELSQDTEVEKLVAELDRKIPS